MARTVCIIPLLDSSDATVGYVRVDGKSALLNVIGTGIGKDERIGV